MLVFQKVLGNMHIVKENEAIAPDILQKLSHRVFIVQNVLGNMTFSKENDVIAKDILQYLVKMELLLRTSSNIWSKCSYRYNPCQETSIRLFTKMFYSLLNARMRARVSSLR